MTQEANHIDAAIADLEAWREQISVAIETLRHFGAKGPTLPSSAPPGTSRSNGEISSDAFFQMTVTDAAEKYLKIKKTPMEIPDMADALLRGGLKSSSKNFVDMLRPVLSRDERFVKVPAGGWGLSEWYPAMRKERRPNPTKRASQRAKKGQPKNPREAGEGTAESKILAAMRSNPVEEWTASKLIQKTGLKEKTVQGTIFRLRKSGRITNRVGGKGYVVV